MEKIKLEVELTNNLRKLMANKGFRTIQALAEETGLHPNTLYKLDKGENSKINLESVCKLLWAFDCTFEELFSFGVTSNEPESWDDLSDDVKEAIQESRAERKSTKKKG